VTAMRINGIDLHVEQAGAGPPLVIVHGGWGDHTTWAPTTRLLAEHFRVVAYDRRGHSRSERPARGWTRRDNEDDLIALIEALDLAAAHVVGNSYGGLVALSVAARRPDLVRGVSVHEPPAIQVAPAAAVAAEQAAIAAAARQVAAGDAEGGTRRFMEDVAFGPGAWGMLPAALRALLVGNAPAFVTEGADPHWPALDLDGVRAYPGPVQLTKGDAAPPWFSVVVDRLAGLIPEATVDVVPGAGHAPHSTHPEAYAEVVSNSALLVRR